MVPPRKALTAGFFAQVLLTPFFFFFSPPRSNVCHFYFPYLFSSIPLPQAARLLTADERAAASVAAASSFSACAAARALLLSQGAGEARYRLLRAGHGSAAADLQLRIAPGSVLFKCQPSVVLFTSVARTETGAGMRGCVLLSRYCCRSWPHTFT